MLGLTPGGARTSRGLAGRGDGHLVLTPVPSHFAAERVEREHISREGLGARRAACRGCSRYFGSSEG